MPNFTKNITVWVIITLILIALFNVFESNSDKGGGNVIAYSDFLERVESGEIKEVTINRDKISGSTNSINIIRSLKKLLEVIQCIFH